MKKQLMGIIGVATLVFASSSAIAASGEALFKQHCVACHPDGGNIVNPKRTLHKKDMDLHGLKSREDVVRYLRKPGPGMPVFDGKIIADKDARAIADYVLKTYK